MGIKSISGECLGINAQRNKKVRSDEENTVMSFRFLKNLDFYLEAANFPVGIISSFSDSPYRS